MLPTDQIKIRKAQLSELSVLLEFEQQIITAERPFENNMKSGKVSYYDLEQLVVSDDAEVLVAEMNNQLIGSGYAKIKKSKDYLKDDHHAYLGFMYVDQDYRGKGVNQLIIENLINWSKKRGIKVICLEVYDKNASAIKAYNKVGFSHNIIEMRMNLDY